jgi:hypothetical protein
MSPPEMLIVLEVDTNPKEALVEVLPSKLTFITPPD